MENLALKHQIPASIESFSEGIASDFDHLLNTLRGRVSLMMNMVKPSDPLYYHLSELVQTVDAGSEIVRELMDISCSDEYLLHSFDLNWIVNDVIEKYHFEENISLDIHFNARPLMVEADSSKIEQVLINVVENAVQAMPEGGNLLITTETARMVNGTAAAYGLEPGPFAKITIVDNGRGMEKEVLQRIFDPFFSYHPESSQFKRGLGLTFSRDTVQDHGGVIDVGTTPDFGSLFSIFLPLDDPENHTDFSETDTSETDNFAPEYKGTILFVDDDLTLLDLGRTFCEVLGYDVLTADSGKKGLRLYKESKKRIDLVVLDLVMPGMDGFEVFKALKEFDPDVNVLISTGSFMENKIREMMDQGCCGYLQKPYGLEEISLKLEEILENQ